MQNMSPVRLMRLFALACVAQTHGGEAISGTVTDPTGAVVCGAKVTLLNDAIVSKDATADGQGWFRIDTLPPGEYRLRIAAGGFVTYEAVGLQVAAGVSLTHNCLSMVGVKAEVTLEDSPSAREQTQTSMVECWGSAKNCTIDQLSSDPSTTVRAPPENFRQESFSIRRCTSRPLRTPSRFGPAARTNQPPAEHPMKVCRTRPHPRW